jgi:hypothetical protein
MDQKINKSFGSLFEDLNGVPFSPESESINDSSVSLTDEMDHLILMHRDAHFGADFQVMLDYYQNENHIGIDPDVDPFRIQYLQQVEQQMGADLAPLILSAAEAEMVGRCRAAYSSFKDIYDQPEETISSARLLADLILSEEEEPIQAIEAIVANSELMFPHLIELTRSDEAYSPFFPGYGYAPYLAALCLGKIKNPEALVPLFNIFHKECVFSDEVLLDAFAEIGVPAKIFLMNRLNGRPLTHDNMHAAFALSVFAQDSQVAQLALKNLQDVNVQRSSLLCSYLLCLCDELQKMPEKDDLIALGNKANIPKELHMQIKNLVRDWH